MPINNKFELKPLADYSLCEPIISARALELHHDKHLRTYVDNLNNLIVGTEWEGKSLEEIIRHAPEGPILNNAGQVYNHNMFFEQLKSGDFRSDGYEPADLIEDLDETMHNFRDEFKQAGLSLFGSGWVWLSLDKRGDFVITQERNASTPLRSGLIPLLTIDVWEHAYYLDYQNRRAEYLEKMWQIIDWYVCTSRYDAAIAQIRG